MEQTRFALTDPVAVDVDEALLRLSPSVQDQRKWRLFACGCCRQAWPLLENAGARHDVEMVERLADGQTSARQILPVRHRTQASNSTASAWAVEAIATLTAWDNRLDTVLLVAHHAARALRDAERSMNWSAARRRQADLLLDIFGKVDEPVPVDPRWLRWNDGIVAKIAATIYDEHRFAEMPVLGDALEEAGCGSMELLDHCRHHTEHARGCWLLDSIRSPDVLESIVERMPGRP